MASTPNAPRSRPGPGQGGTEWSPGWPTKVSAAAMEWSPERRFRSPRPDRGRQGRRSGRSRLDRLARNLTVQEGILATRGASDASIHAADLGEIARDDPDDPMRTALRQMVGVFAQLERGMIAARLRGGRRQKADKAATHTAHRPSDGAPTTVNWYRSTLSSPLSPGSKSCGQRASLRAIAATLEAEGRPTRRGGHWQPTVLAKILAA